MICASFYKNLSKNSPLGSDHSLLARACHKPPARPREQSSTTRDRALPASGQAYLLRLLPTRRSDDLARIEQAIRVEKRFESSHPGERGAVFFGHELPLDQANAMLTRGRAAQRQRAPDQLF